MIFTGCNFPLEVKMLPVKCQSMLPFNILKCNYFLKKGSSVQALSTGVNGITERETNIRIFPQPSTLEELPIMICLKMSLAAAGECQ